MGVSVQGSTASAPSNSAPSLLALDPYTPEDRTIDIYALGSGSVDFSIAASAPHVKITPSQGTISYPSGKSTVRAVVEVDWSLAPNGSSTSTITITPKTGTAVKLNLPLNNNAVPSGFKGYVESNGAVAMEMRHFTDRTSASSDASLEAIPNYGRTDSGLTLLPITAGTQTTDSGPSAAYSFYAFTTSTSAKVIAYLPPSFNVNPASPLKYAVSLDDGAPKTVTPVPSSTLGSMPQGWSESVINGARVIKTDLGSVSKGAHKLKVWLLEPGTVIHRLVIDLGGVKDSYLGPPESSKVGY